MIRGAFEAIAVVLCLSTASTSGEAQSSAPPTITLPQSLHFRAPDGSDLVAEPAVYQVLQGPGASLHLISEGKAALVIQALATTHEVELTVPLALFIPIQENEHHVVLLLPDWQGLDAIGSRTGIRSPGPSLRPLSSPALKRAWSQRSAARTIH